MRKDLPWLREIGNAYLARLFPDAPAAVAGNDAASAHEDAPAPDCDTAPACCEAAGLGGEVEGTAGGGEPAAAQDPNKFCWRCKTPEPAVELRVCKGCNRVRFHKIFLSHKKLILLLNKAMFAGALL